MTKLCELSKGIAQALSKVNKSLGKKNYQIIKSAVDKNEIITVEHEGVNISINKLSLIEYTSLQLTEALVKINLTYDSSESKDKDNKDDDSYEIINVSNTKDDNAITIEMELKFKENEKTNLAIIDMLSKLTHASNSSVIDNKGNKE